MADIDYQLADFLAAWSMLAVFVASGLLAIALKWCVKWCIKQLKGRTSPDILHNDLKAQLEKTRMERSLW